MAKENWVIGNLEHALETWNEKLSEIWSLVSQSPETFKGGALWHVVLNIHDGMRAIGYALLVLFFVVGVMKTCGSLNCSRLISVWDGTPSGTGNAVRYAAKQGITIVNLLKTE